METPHMESFLIKKDLIVIVTKTRVLVIYKSKFTVEDFDLVNGVLHKIESRKLPVELKMEEDI